MIGPKSRCDACRLESLESRVFLSLAVGAGETDTWLAEAAKRGGGTTAPAIRLDLVALHEFGHSLGLPHTSDTSSIMYPYYDAGYDLADFASDPAVAEFRTLYSKESTRPWKDALDADGGVTDGDVDLTYSFVLDGARMDQGGRSNTFSTLNRIFGAGKWEPIFAAELQRWASVSGGTLQVRPFDADGVENAVYSFNTSGSVQNDSRFGDIRIATHKFDGAGKVLAHTYYPPPNGLTAAGDSHYDAAENWVLADSPLTGSFTSTTSAQPLLSFSPLALRAAAATSATPSPFSSIALTGLDGLLA